MLTGKYWEEFRAEPARTVEFVCSVNTESANISLKDTPNTDREYFSYKNEAPYGTTFSTDVVKTLQPGKRYYYRAVAKLSFADKRYIWGEIKSFTAPVDE